MLLFLLGSRAAAAALAGRARASIIRMRSHRWQRHSWAQRHAQLRMSTSLLPAYVPSEDVSAISEAEAISAIASMQYVSLELSNAVASGPVNVSYLSTQPSGSQASAPPLLLVHGFDISCLEYRRLLPQLEAAGLEAFAPCIPGWGFTDTAQMRTVGVDGKREALLAFHESVLGGRPAVWVGASLGACVALDCFVARPAAVQSLVCLDPGFFTDPPPAVPDFVGRLLLRQVLSAPGVRRSIAKQAYFDKDGQTDDAIRCGNLHLRRPKWEEDSLEWLLSGAYGAIEEKVPLLASVPTLTLWGRQVIAISLDLQGISLYVHASDSLLLLVGAAG